MTDGVNIDFIPNLINLGPDGLIDQNESVVTAHASNIKVH